MKKLNIIGNIGADCIETSNDSLMFNVGVTSIVGKNEKGEQLKHTDWITVFTKLKTLKPHLLKGKKVFISGTPKFGTYQNPNTNEISVNVTISFAEITLC